MTPELKQNLIAEHRRHDGDSGSQEVQVALLTSRILELSDHLKTHKKDHSSRRGLLKMVGRRAGLLKSLRRVDTQRYQSVIQRHGLRK